MRYLKNVFYAFLVWLCASFLMNVPAFLFGGVLYPALEDWFPGVFVEINPVTSPVEYERFETVMNLITAVLTVFLISYLCVRFDNERMEYMIRLTEGMYLRGEGCAIYYPRYLRADLMVSLLVPLPLLIGSLFLPSQLPEALVSVLNPIINILFGFTFVFTDALGYILAYILMALSLLLSRLIFGFTSLSAWQGAWLSETY